MADINEKTREIIEKYLAGNKLAIRSAIAAFSMFDSMPDGLFERAADMLGSNAEVRSNAKVLIKMPESIVLIIIGYSVGWDKAALAGQEMIDAGIVPEDQFEFMNFLIKTAPMGEETEPMGEGNAN